MHKSCRAALGGVVALVLSLGGGAGAQAKGLKILYSFCPEQGCDYAFPTQPIVRDAAGNLFGVTGSMPATRGIAFELSRGKRGWTFHKLFDFCRTCGLEPVTPLIVDKDDNLYGIVGDDNDQFNAVIFKLSPGAEGAAWTFSALHRFKRDKATLQAGLTYAGAASGLPYDGVSPLYGASPVGGSAAQGTIFSLTPSAGTWQFETLHTFCRSICRGGAAPLATLTTDAGGNLYGVTSAGGKNAQGVVFKLTPANDRWNETVLYDFCSQANCADGMMPTNNSITFDAAGNIYGTTAAGGACVATICGVAYRLSPDGRQTVIHDFGTEFDQFLDNIDGIEPMGGLVTGANRLIGVTVQGGDGGNIYPNSHGSGTIFALNAKHKVLYTFCRLAGCADGAFPQGPLASDGKGRYYGVTQNGGSIGGGEIFEFTP